LFQGRGIGIPVTDVVLFAAGQRNAYHGKEEGPELNQITCFHSFWFLIKFWILDYQGNYSLKFVYDNNTPAEDFTLIAFSFFIFPVIFPVFAPAGEK